MAGYGSNETTLRLLYHTVCAQGGDSKSVPLRRILQDCSRNTKLSKEYLKSLIKKHPELFIIVFDIEGHDKFIKAKTDLSLCEEHCRKEGCTMVNGECNGLHLCKFFIIGTCKIKGKPCEYGHDMRSYHNSIILKKYLLDALPLMVVLSLLRKMPKLPRICKFYNVDKGCRSGEKGEKCNSLHVCKHYMLGDCKFGRNCKRSHNIFDQQPKTILEQYGIDVSRSPKEVLEELREEYKASHTEDRETSVQPRPKRTSSQLSQTSSCGSDKDLDTDAEPKLCLCHLQGKCSFGKSCHNQHSSAPYQWQYLVEGEWLDLDQEANKDAEINYCEVANDNCNITTSQKETMRLYFDTMTIRLSQSGSDLPLRRLSTPSSVKVPPHLQQFSTYWLWYFNDDHETWTEYGKKSREDEVDSKVLEAAFGNDDKRFSFTHNGRKATIDFEKMEEISGGLQHQMVQIRRLVRTRPAPPGSQHAAKSNGALDNNHIPSNWAEMAIDEVYKVFDNPSLCHRCFYKFHRVGAMVCYVSHKQVLPTGGTADEYRTVEARFKETMPDRIKRIRRIQNADLWGDFVRKKRKMEKQRGAGQSPTELFLFHGSHQRHEAGICQQGFDWRLSGTSVGTLYGQGSYFHKRANYSKSYTDYRTLYLVRVLVGDYTKGNTSLRRPPLKTPAGGAQKYDVFYDTCVDSEASPSIFVVFDNSQAYPEYLIEY